MPSPPSSSPALADRRRSYDPLPRGQPQSPELAREWLETKQPAAFREKFSLASYNILGDNNAFKHRDMYTNVPMPYLKWNRRKRVICEELIGWNPDIICLQEVDKYFDIFNILQKAGYRSSYKRRTGDAADGCAIFWKANEFKLLEMESIEYKKYGLRDNVAQLAVFKMCRAESRRFVVGNIHVLYNPSRGEVKLGQIRFFSSRAAELAEKWGGTPIVLAGDFNTIPESPIYRFLSSSQLDISPYDRRELSGQRSNNLANVVGLKRDISDMSFLMDRYLNVDWTEAELKTATGNVGSGVAMHPLNLNSSYAIVKGGEPEATSYHSKFIGTVDYIWYSEGLTPTRVLDTPPLDILHGIGALPCENVGSDHLALVTEFAFTEDFLASE
ncbi:hypothetical protein MLD38_026211 [Melastoma candidum]|uniref:Uncharacterized protein n=1 Tax=Melastoma candidum TaxID=119954 RepID=A0ACB9NZ89_9MYRT|nr:hypothetical protein MLD38_026211 [Melastoma candidum]